MIALDLQHDVSQPATRAGMLTALTRSFTAWRRAFEDHRALVRLSRKSPRLLRDMGLDPATIYEAVEGTWDEVPLAQYRSIDD